MKFIFLFLFTLLILFLSDIDHSKEFYIELNSTNVVNLKSGINEGSIDRVIQSYITLRTLYPDQKIYFIIESRGGSIQDGLRLYNIMKNDINLDTIIIKSGSMASMLVQMLPGKRLILENSLMAFHRPFRIIHRNIWNKIEKQVSKRMKLNLDEYRLKAVVEWRTYGKDIINNNMADKIVKIKCSKDLININDSMLDQDEFIPKSRNVSRCPLFEQPLE